MVDQPEHRLSHFVDALLDRVLVEPCWYSAVDHGAAPMGGTKEEQKNARMVRAQRMKARGIKPSHLDWFVYQRGIYAQFELKIGKNDPDDGQETTMRLLRERDIPTGCAKTLRQFYDLLVGAGFALHPNAANILVEIEARYAAADDKAQMIKDGVITKKRYAPKRRGPRYEWKVSQPLTRS
jgi:hypothetical protein